MTATINPMSRDAHIEIQLRSVVDGLVNHTQGAIPRDQLSTIVDDLYDDMAATATIQTFVPVLVGRAALDKVQDQLGTAQEALKEQPEVLIVCQENAGRSQAAAALFRHYAPGLLYVESAGLTPADRVQQTVLDILAAHGVHLTDRASALEPHMLQRAEHLVLIGDVELQAADTYAWDTLPALHGLSAEQIVEVLVDIDLRVRDLLRVWLPGIELGEPVMQGAANPA